MSIISKMRRQVAVYWERSVPDQYGAYSFLAPVEISCRWEEEKKEFRQATGEVLNFSCTVYVDRAMKVGDALKLGALVEEGDPFISEDESDSIETEEDEDRVTEDETPDNPLPDKDAAIIQRFEATPNLKATEWLYTAYL